MEALDALLNRVSVPRLVEPAPTAEQREVMYQAALRAPDHGQLRPWRFLEIEGQGLCALAELLVAAAQAQGEESVKALDKARNMPTRAPLLVAVIACLQDHPKVPHAEQLLTAGCAAHGLLLAAYAQGVGAVWRTGPLSYSPQVCAGLGLAANERMLGFIYVGTPQNPPREAPRPATAEVVKAWPF